MMKSRRLLCAVCLLLFTGAAFSQKEDIQFEHLSMKDGLSMNPIMAIAQDRKGFLWFGTQDGLNRYDGYSFTVYKSDDLDSNSISDNFITALCVDDSGRLWAGTLNGLNLFNSRTGKFSVLKKNGTTFPSDRIYCLFTDASGLLWIGTENGIAVLDPATKSFLNLKTRFPGISVLAQKSVLCIQQDSEGSLWFGTSSGLVQYQASTGTLRNFFSSAQQDGSLSNNIVLSIFEDSKKNLWFGTLDGLNRYDRKNHSFTHQYFKENSGMLASTKKNKALEGANIYSIVNNYGGNTIRCILEDANGLFWIGTDMELIIFNPSSGNFINYKKDLINPTGINDHFIRSMFVDRSGNLWIGTLGNGLNKVNLKPKKFQHYQKKINNPGSLSENYVRSICEDDSGSIWIGTLVGGLNRFDPKTQLFTSFTKEENLSENSINDNNVWSVGYDRNNNGLWIGTNNGLDFYDFMTKKFSHFQHDEKDPGSISDNTIRNVFIDSMGTLWCGTENGLNRFDRQSNTFTSWNRQNSALSNNTVWKIAEDKNGRLWLATNDGLNSFDPAFARFDVYKKINGDSTTLSHNGVRSLLSMNNGVLWVGTHNGLNRMDPVTKKFTRYSEKEGLPNSFIYGIVKDYHGNLWLSTNKGLTMMDEDGKFRNYDIYDGLQDYEFNTNACFSSSSGDIYFGGPGGFNQFNPDSFEVNTFIPPVVITSVKVMDKLYLREGEIPELNVITLNYDENIIYLAFASLDYTNPSRNKFVFKMEGFNEGWVNAGSYRSITYTNLDPGVYTFMVKGSNVDGTWNEKPAILKIRILPPFWRTWWFYSLCMVSGMSGIVVFIRQRTKNLMRQRNMLEQKVKQRTQEVEMQKDELAQKNKDITDSISYAKRIQDAIVPGEQVFLDNFSDAFVLYRPRDIVSGDFYWFTRVRTSGANSINLKIVAAIDCTGHGVPGAFMSLIASEMLSQTIKDPEINSPGDVLRFLNSKLPQALNRNAREKIRDGMDLGICAIDDERRKVYFAGANRPLWIIRKNGEFEQVVPDKFSVGGFTEATQEFRNHGISFEPGDTFYLFSDGYADQFGGPKNKKIGSRKFRELILSSAKLSMKEQKEFLIAFLEQWMGENQQVDDICVIGLRF